MAEQAGQAEHPPAATTAAKKRRRPPLSCEQCRRRKIKCDREFPCGHCVRADAGACTYAPTHTPKPRRRAPHGAVADADAARSGVSSPGGGSVPRRPAGASTVVNLRPTARATQIQTPDSEEFHRASVWQLLPPSSAAAQRQSDEPETHRSGRAAHGEPASSGGAAHRSGEVFGERRRSESTPPPKGSISKGRYFGQSHWMNVSASFPVELSMLKNQEYTQGELFRILYQCKVLCQKIKTIRSQPLSSLDIGKNTLPRAVCDELVEAYLRTFEGVYRILHIPTFRKEYASYWQDPSGVGEGFVMLMQLCAVLGSSVRAAPVASAARPAAAALKITTTRWIYEAHMWLILPPEKGRMTLTGVQVQCLLTLAKMTCGVSADLTWVMAGSLLRTAMYMGLHRDPSRLSSGASVYRAEMRRRLWATVLELNLLYAFEAGGMPLVSEDDYDALPPADLDDEALDDDTTDDSRRAGQASSGKGATQMSVPLAVFKSLPLRMELLRYINDFRAGVDYDKTLRLNSDLTKACRLFTQTIGAVTKHQDDNDSSSARIAPFHVSLAEMMLYRCLHALHFPVLFTAFDDPRFYFSRKMCLDGALKIADLLGFTRPRAPSPTSDFGRLVIHGTGMFKNIPVQVSCIIALELIHDTAGGGPGLGPSLAPAAEGHATLLRTCLDSALGWMLDRMRAGEVTAKGHCFVSACVAHTEALERGLDKAATMALLVSRATEAARLDLGLIRAVARESGVPVAEEEDGEEEEGGGQVDAAESSAVDVGTIEALAASWDGGGGGGGISWAWDEADDWMWGGAWSSQLNVPMPLDSMRQFFEAPVGYPR
ncbi:C6 zinc finger domain-containing protein [Cordyceps fumosorosea ARSEF 2679]|uniref:C6 zinc finger domain-containing protein n=1 Tax=Cordyceps fumosorosea (strain ARSEF 2679) TaxID=1081104 RepID=A0A168BPS0_CORFA|nr:C6 zinc finger domain-containing protein [Cordyceps fumosorosea ARSEF 2679]OAA70393.1 C6 zinc finger domain-containing protein [Cordyceps fumosorosea ARSEF 2679]